MPLYLFRMMRKLRHARFELWLVPSLPSLQPGSTLAFPSPLSDEATGVRFEDATAASAIGSLEPRAGYPEKPYLSETIGPGVTLGDYENDGWLEIHFVNALSDEARKGTASPNPAALFRNNRDGSFTDATAQAGVGNRRGGRGGRLRGRHR